MKKSGLFAWFICIINISVLAQGSKLEYSPFAQEGKTWEIQVGGIKENLYGHQLNGDTIINGESWKKVYNFMGFPDFNYTYYAAVRDVEGKVYAIAKGSTKQRLLYNFSLNEGDMVKCGVEGNSFGCLLESGEKPDTLFGFPFVSYLIVERIDIIKSCGVEHRRITLSFLDKFKMPLTTESGTERCNVVWVEGIGSGAGQFSPWQLLPPKYRIQIRCFLNKEEIFSNGFYENDGTSTIGATDYKKDWSSTTYNLKGLRQSTIPKKGIYIQNGKKVVVK